MKFKPIYLAVGGLFLAAILAAAAKQLGGESTSEPLTEKEATALIEERYQGEVLDIKKESGSYWIELQKSQGIYRIKLNASRGEIISFEKFEEISPHNGQKTLKKEKVIEIIQAEEKGKLVSLKRVSENEKTTFQAVLQEDNQKVKIIIDALSGEILTRQIVTEPVSKRLTEKEAAQIALKELPGEVDGVDFEVTENASYYLVEIETADSREVVVQINAITGEVMSVTWDD
jgi:uncharacterized membrane protein YkoI